MKTWAKCSLMYADDIQIDIGTDNVKGGRKKVWFIFFVELISEVSKLLVKILILMYLIKQTEICQAYSNIQ